MLRGGDPLL